MMGTDRYLIEVLICICLLIGCTAYQPLDFPFLVMVCPCVFLLLICSLIFNDLLYCYYMYVCASVCLFMLVQVPAEARKRCQMS